MSNYVVSQNYEKYAVEVIQYCTCLFLYTSNIPVLAKPNLATPWGPEERHAHASPQPAYVTTSGRKTIIAGSTSTYNIDLLLIKLDQETDDLHHSG